VLTKFIGTNIDTTEKSIEAVLEFGVDVNTEKLNYL
jgi:hypothetical protein